MTGTSVRSQAQGPPFELTNGKTGHRQRRFRPLADCGSEKAGESCEHAGERPFPAAESASRPPHSSGDTPQRPTPAAPEVRVERPARPSGVRAPRRARRTLRPETPAVSALPPPPPIRRPSATIRRDRFPPERGRDTGGLPCSDPGRLRPALPACALLHPHVLRAAPGVRGTAQAPLRLGRSLSLHRSRVRKVRSLTPVGCLIIAPASGGRSCGAGASGPSTPQGIARCGALHLDARR
jgi:hypothetical protein